MVETFRRSVVDQGKCSLRLAHENLTEQADHSQQYAIHWIEGRVVPGWASWLFKIPPHTWGQGQSITWLLWLTYHNNMSYLESRALGQGLISTWLSWLTFQSTIKPTLNPWHMHIWLSFLTHNSNSVPTLGPWHRNTWLSWLTYHSCSCRRRWRTPAQVI